MPGGNVPGEIAVAGETEVDGVPDGVPDGAPVSLVGDATDVDVAPWVDPAVDAPVDLAEAARDSSTNRCNSGVR